MEKDETKRAEAFRTWVLRTGLPFENNVRAILDQANHSGSLGLDRPFEFTLDHEDGHTEIRSLDFKANIVYPAQVSIVDRDQDEFFDFTLLIDAKRLEEHAFVFAASEFPNPIEFAYMVPAYRKRASAANRTLAKTEVKERITEIALHNPDWFQVHSGRKAPLGTNPGSVGNPEEVEKDFAAKAIIQLTQGTAQEIRRCIGMLRKPKDPEDEIPPHRRGYLFLPIVVTQAPLYVIQPGTTEEVVRAAKDKSEYCSEVSVVVHEQLPIGHVQKMLSILMQDIGSHRIGDFVWHVPDLRRMPVIFCNPPSLQAVMDFFDARISEIVASE